ncbi:MAG: N-acetylmuramoyl-L-alanine amidase [Deltaproteobacteria bacterium]|nr:N-acetylmuramoyl-L-alanine amidase [Deltaproteobacteria bacterium]
MSLRRIAAVVACHAATACVDAPGAPWAEPPPGMPNEFAVVEGALNGAEYGPADWQASVNFKVANRGVGSIKTVVVHTIQGSYAGCISWFKNPSAQVSAHYVISKTGAITQMVKEKDIAWHVGSENGYTIGIEHEGYVSDANWVTPQMLDASALLTCYLVKKYQLQASKASIKGHVELPNQTHTDPGKYWPWDSYIAKVGACVNGGVQPPTCPASCDDGKACTNDACSNGQCVYSPNTGAVCWDGDACTAGEKCQNGACVGGSIVKDCNDNNPCTNDGCTAGNCTHTANGNGCDDGNPCTGGDKCQNGACKGGTAVACNDNNPCTDDGCAAGACTYSNNAAPCDDGNACTGGDHCQGGKCGAGGPVACNDNNPCTTDSCSDGKCNHAAKTGPCDDGNACSTGEACSNGNCAGGAPKLCNDENPCTSDSCLGGNCLHGGVVGSCDDGDDCTVEDYCAQGLCLSGLAKNCDDGNPCSSDSCADGNCTHSGDCTLAADAGAADIDHGDGGAPNADAAPGLADIDVLDGRQDGAGRGGDGALAFDAHGADTTAGIVGAGGSGGGLCAAQPVARGPWVVGLLVVAVGTAIGRRRRT